MNIRPVTHVIVGSIIGASVAGGGLAVASINEPHGRLATVINRQCASEDSLNCSWNARVQGNGTGHSFTTIQVNGETCVFYWGKRYARTHDTCR
jgi:hypothetical protein